MTPSSERINWKLPQGCNYGHPEYARAAERLRAGLLSLYDDLGYAMLDLPLMEFSLGQPPSPSWSKHFHVQDPISGETLRLRSDATQQVGRYVLSQNPSLPARYCYAARLVHPRPEFSGTSRTPVQMGTELIDGIASPENDAEAICLMHKSGVLAGMKGLILGLGHAGLVAEVLDALSLSAEHRQLTFRLLQRRAHPSLKTFLEGLEISNELVQTVLFLSQAHGSLASFYERDWQDTPIVAYADHMHHLRKVVEFVAAELGQSLVDSWTYDLGEVHGRAYHDGVTFAAFGEGVPVAVMRGGRYSLDTNGDALRAIGFSARLDVLLAAAEV